LLDFRNAVEEYSIALRLTQSSTDLENTLIKARLNSYEKALMKARHELASPNFSEDPVYHYNIGNKTLFEGHLKEARRRYSAALRLDPTNDVYKKALLRTEEEIFKQKERNRQERERRGPRLSKKEEMKIWRDEQFEKESREAQERQKGYEHARGYDQNNW
jgi:Tfp pilus assembly protein PilF